MVAFDRALARCQRQIYLFWVCVLSLYLRQRGGASEMKCPICGGHYFPEHGGERCPESSIGEPLTDTQLGLVVFEFEARCKDKDGGTIQQRQVLSALQELQRHRVKFNPLTHSAGPKSPT